MTNEFLKDHPELEKLFERLTNEPDSHVFAPLADSCRKIGRLEEALDICRNGLERHPDYASGHVVLGKCLYDGGNTESAKAAFQKVLSLDENNLVALKYLGLILSEEGDEAAAMEHFKHILALDPDNVEIRGKLENLQGSEDNYTPGTEPSVAEPSSEEDEEIIQLDEILEEDFEGSAIRLGEVEETSDELATLTLADIYASQGYVHKAKGIYEEVLRKWPDHSQAKAKLAALELERAEPAQPVEDEPPEDDMEEDAPLLEDIPAPTDNDEPTAESEPPVADDSPVNCTAGEEAAPPEYGAGEEAVPPEDEAAPDGRPIDNRTDIEKFKKWIERMSE